MIDLLLVAFILTVYTCIYCYKRFHDPPGPLGVPFFGAVIDRAWLFINGKCRGQTKFYDHMKSQYGGLWSRRVLGVREVGIASLEIIQEGALTNSDIFKNRPENEMFAYLSQGGGIIFLGQNLWKQHRKFTIKFWHELARHHNMFRDLIMSETKTLVKRLELSQNQGVESHRVYSKSAMHIVKIIVLNESYEESDGEDDQIIESIRIIGKDDIVHGMLLFMSRFNLSRFNNIIPSFSKFMRHKIIVENWAEKKVKQVEKRSRSRAVKPEPNCIIEYLIRQNEIYQNYSSKINSQTGTFDIHQITRICYDIFGAGIDTTTHTLCWATLVLSVLPDIQHKLRQELQEYMSQDSSEYLTYETVMTIDYYLAFIHELFRLFPVIPRIPHSTDKKDVYFRGYHFQPDDLVQFDYMSINRDSALWKDPLLFKPQRFLQHDIDGKEVYKPNKNLHPFGIGQRSCMGESLAKMELASFLANIVVKFEMKLSERYEGVYKDGVENGNLKPNMLLGSEGLVYGPLDHKIIYTPITK